MLEIREVTKNFGGLRAVDGVSFKVRKGEIVGVIGPNASGKTTLVNLITGFLKPTGGMVLFEGERIESLPPYNITKIGIGRTFQVCRVFRKMTVLENMLVPGLSVCNRGEERRIKRRISEVLDFLKLTHLKDEYARNLSGGQQKLLEFGRVLMLNPKVVLLDEPFAGVHPRLKVEQCGYIEEMQKLGKTFIIISHDMGSIFRLSQRIIVMSHGEKIADDDPQQIKMNEKVVESYLGK